MVSVWTIDQLSNQTRLTFTMTASCWWTCFLALISCLSQVNCESDHGDRVQFQDRFYYLSREPATWPEANKACGKYGTNVRLAVITNEEQQDWLRSTLPYRDLWVGLNDLHEEGHWLWIDGTYPNYTNWAPSHPTNSSDDNCVLMSHQDGYWRQKPCHNKHHYVCLSSYNHAICHSGGIFFRDRCYWIDEPRDSWNGANAYCTRFGDGVRMVVIRDGEVNAFLSKLVYPDIWIGLSDRDHEGHWEWVDGSRPFFTNWLPTEPNNANRREDCALLHYGTGGWTDVPCYRSGSFHRTVCVLPPCDNEGSGDAGPCASESPFCSCVSDGYCLDNGKCHCLKRFHGMVCDKAEVQVQLRTAGHVNEGDSIELKCHVNIPKKDFSLQMKRVGMHGIHTPLPEQTTQFYIDEEENGYYKVVVSNVTSNDTAYYVCVVTTTAGVLPVTRIESQFVKVRALSDGSSPDKKKEPDKANNSTTSQADKTGSRSVSGLTVAVAVLAVCFGLLIIVLIVVKVRARRKQRGYLMRMSSLEQ